DHLADADDPVRVEEHVLGTAKTDPFGAELACGLGVARSLGVGANAESADLIGPFHQLREIARHVRLAGWHLAEHYFTGRAVEGYQLAFADGVAAAGQSLGFVIDAELPCAGHAGAPHAACDHGRVAGHPAAGGQDSPRGVHAVNVFGAGLDPDQDH